MKLNSVRILNNSDFDARGIPRMNTNKPIIVAILSEGCPWCTRAAAELEKLAGDRRIEVTAIMSGPNSLASSMLRATKSSGVPTFIVFRNKKFRGHISGYKDAQALVQYAMTI